ncbi:MAG: MtrAB system histidine kinase MtrB [Microbacterium gubbeenense]|uniref:MtrAB system histidine kinase MtrB n=1 Tax=Microbacterium gubbeenense TaxID=159896 RepID=UPI003F97B068
MVGARSDRHGARSIRFVQRPVTAWRISLLFRTVVIATAATTVAVIIATVWAALAIQSDLYGARTAQVEEDTKRAIDFTQQNLYDAAPATDRAAIQSLRQSMLEDLSASSSTHLIVGGPIPGLTSDDAPSAFKSRSDVFDASLVPDGLREQVRTVPETQWLQPIGLTGVDGRVVPGIIVGQQIQLPPVGSYEVFFAYPLTDVVETLVFVQGALALTGIALVVIMGAVVWLVMRSVVAPVVDVARASARFADGDLSARLVESGQDELAVLSRSFNQMADSIENQIRELADLSLVQQRFVSDVSHELRTPLTTIQLAAEVLYGDRDDFDPIAARSAELLHDQVGRFEQLLTDLLEISRYDAGSVELEREETSLSGVAEQVAESMRQVAWQNDTEVRFRGADGDDVIPMDPRRIRRILRNLVGNAIEHSENRPVFITVAQNDTAVSVGVRDQGLGMRPEHVERVFDRFWRADPSRQRTLGGTGLGLAIALGDARLHDGAIDVWSEIGVGTHFVVTLPRVPGPEQEVVPPIAAQPVDELTTGDLRAGNGTDTETLVVMHKPEGER